MAVSKCKECGCFTKKLSSNTFKAKNNEYWCGHFKVSDCNLGIFGRNISSKDVKTSPKWCPKREVVQLSK